MIGVLWGWRFYSAFPEHSCKNTLIILIICNIILLFTLSDDEEFAFPEWSRWETTAMLMGDSGLKPSPEWWHKCSGIPF